MTFYYKNYKVTKTLANETITVVFDNFKHKIQCVITEVSSDVISKQDLFDAITEQNIELSDTLKIAVEVIVNNKQKVIKFEYPVHETAKELRQLNVFDFINIPLNFVCQQLHVFNPQNSANVRNLHILNFANNCKELNPLVIKTNSCFYEWSRINIELKCVKKYEDKFIYFIIKAGDKHQVVECNTWHKTMTFWLPSGDIKIKILNAGNDIAKYNEWLVRIYIDAAI